MHTDKIKTRMNFFIRVCAKNLAADLAPLLRLHLLFRETETVNHELLSEIHERIRAAGVKNGIRQIGGDFLNPFRRDATGATRPIVFGRGAGAGNEEFEIGILGFELAKFRIEDDILRLAHAIKHRDLRVELAARGFAREGTERRDARTAGDADQVFIWFQHGEKLSHGRYDKNFITGFGPIHHARAHLAIALDGHFVKATIRPVERDELARLEFGVVPIGPFEFKSFRVGQFHRCRFDDHFENFFSHSASGLEVSRFNSRRQATKHQ